MCNEREQQRERLRAEIHRLRTGTGGRSVQEVRKAVEAALAEELRRLAESEGKGEGTRPKQGADTKATTEETDGGEPE